MPPEKIERARDFFGPVLGTTDVYKRQGEAAGLLDRDVGTQQGRIEVHGVNS